MNKTFDASQNPPYYEPLYFNQQNMAIGNLESKPSNPTVRAAHEIGLEAFKNAGLPIEGMVIQGTEIGMFAKLKVSQANPLTTEQFNQLESANLSLSMKLYDEGKLVEIIIGLPSVMAHQTAHEVGVVIDETMPMNVQEMMMAAQAAAETAEAVFMVDVEAWFRRAAEEEV